MGKIFNMDSPFFQLMERVTDFVILNILTIICSLPLFTVGAALTAHHKVMQNFVMDSEQPVLRSYFRAFAGNFKQATVVWLITAALLALIAVDVWFIYMYLDGLAFMLYVILAVVSAILLGTTCYAFALIARYDNTLKDHLKNSFVLAVGNLPKTVLMLAIWVIAPVVVVLALELSFNFLLILATLGISLIIYAHTRILKPVFLMLEQEEDEEEKDDKDNTAENEVVSL